MAHQRVKNIKFSQVSYVTGNEFQFSHNERIKRDDDDDDYNDNDDDDGDDDNNNDNNKKLYGSLTRETPCYKHKYRTLTGDDHTRDSTGPDSEMRGKREVDIQS